MFYFCSLGSNIDPANHVCSAIATLVATVAPITLSPIIQTEPHGMHSSQPFLNALFWFESDLGASAIKHIFNSIEVRLGRDRTAPDKKTRDRTIDLDILYAGVPCVLAELQVNDPYLAPLLPVLSGKVPTGSMISVPFAGCRLGLGLVRISRDGEGFKIVRSDGKAGKDVAIG